MRKAGRMLPKEELDLDWERAPAGGRNRSWRKRERRKRKKRKTRRRRMKRSKRKL